MFEQHCRIRKEWFNRFESVNLAVGLISEKELSPKKPKRIFVIKVDRLSLVKDVIFEDEFVILPFSKTIPTNSVQIE